MGSKMGDELWKGEYRSLGDAHLKDCLVFNLLFSVIRDFSPL